MFLADVCSVCGIEFDPEDPDVDFYAVDGICSVGCMKDMFENEGWKNSYQCRICGFWLELDEFNAAEFMDHCQVCPPCFYSTE